MRPFRFDVLIEEGQKTKASVLDLPGTAENEGYDMADVSPVIARLAET